MFKRNPSSLKTHDRTLKISTPYFYFHLTKLQKKFKYKKKLQKKSQKYTLIHFSIKFKFPKQIFSKKILKLLFKNNFKYLNSLPNISPTINKIIKRKRSKTKYYYLIHIIKL